MVVHITLDLILFTSFVNYDITFKNNYSTIPTIQLIMLLYGSHSENNFLHNYIKFNQTQSSSFNS